MTFSLPVEFNASVVDEKMVGKGAILTLKFKKKKFPFSNLHGDAPKRRILSPICITRDLIG
jgi:hypothetical protein